MRPDYQMVTLIAKTSTSTSPGADSQLQTSPQPKSRHIHTSNDSFERPRQSCQMSDLNSGKADSAIFLDLQMYPGVGELLDAILISIVSH